VLVRYFVEKTSVVIYLIIEAGKNTEVNYLPHITSDYQVSVLVLVLTTDFKFAYSSIYCKIRVLFFLNDLKTGVDFILKRGSNLVL
jgi:hypothetical protein